MAKFFSFRQSKHNLAFVNNFESNILSKHLQVSYDKEVKEVTERLLKDKEF